MFYEFEMKRFSCFIQLDLLVISGVIAIYSSLVSGKISLTKSPTDVFASLGTRVTLECSPNTVVEYILWSFRPSGTNQKKELATIMHTKGAQLTPNFEAYEEYSASSNGELTVSNLKFRNDGTYFCMVMKGIHEGAKGNATITVLTSPVNARISFQPNILEENVSVKFQCNSSHGNPPPRFQWYLKYPDGRVDNITHLAIDTAARQTFGTSVSTFTTKLSPTEDGSVVQCIAKNRVNETATDRHLDVKYLPRIEAFSFNPYIVQENKSFRYQCKARGNPQPRFIWKAINGRIFQNNLSFRRIGRNQSGIYSCVAENKMGIAVLNLTLDVHYPPTVTIPQEVKAPVGTKVILSCSVDSRPSPRNIDWSSSSNTGQFWYGANLEIPSVTRQHDGDYKCRAENVMQPSNLTWVTATNFSVTKLTIQYSPGKPRIESSSMKKEYKVGDTVKVKCLENIQDPGNPHPDFEWQDLSTNEIVSRKPTLIFVHAGIGNNGRYMCIPHNLIGQGPGSEVEITINEPPILGHNLSQIQSTFQLGHPGLIVNCTVRSKPSATVTWWRNSNLLFPNGTLDARKEMFSIKSKETRLSHGETQVVSELHWVGGRRSGGNKLEAADNAKFSCVAVNSLGRVSTSLNLQVTFVPRFTSKTNKVATMLGAEKIRIICEVDAVPKPDIQWRLGSILLPDRGSKKYQVLYEHVDEYSYRLILTINGVSRQDLRDYTCTASNEVNNNHLVSTMYFLTKHSIPEPPTNLFIRSYTWESCEITWVPGFDGGYPQQFYIMYTYAGVTKNAKVRSHMGFYNLTGLQPDRNYTICIYAKNRLGTSNCSGRIYYYSPRIKIPRVTDVVVDEVSKTISFKSPPGVYCHRVESSNDEGQTWFNFRECIDPKANSIKITVPKIRKEIAYRISTCLVSRRDVCSDPVPAYMESKLPEIPITVILIVALVCLVVIILLAIILLFFCCRRKRVSKTYETTASNSLQCPAASCFTDSNMTCPPTSPIHLPHSNNNSQTLHSSISNGQINKPYARVPPSNSSHQLHYSELPTSEPLQHYLIKSPSPASSVLYTMQRYPSSNGDCKYSQETMKTSYRQSLIESAKSDDMQESNKMVFPQSPYPPPSDSGYHDGSDQSFLSGTQEAFMLKTFVPPMSRQSGPTLPMRGSGGARTQSYAV